MNAENYLDYSGFDLVAEQFLNIKTDIQQNEVNGSCSSTNSFYTKRTLQNESIISVGNSHWSLAFFLLRDLYIKKHKC